MQLTATLLDSAAMRCFFHHQRKFIWILLLYTIKSKRLAEQVQIPSQTTRSLLSNYLLSTSTWMCSRQPKLHMQNHTFIFAADLLLLDSLSRKRHLHLPMYSEPSSHPCFPLSYLFL